MSHENKPTMGHAAFVPHVPSQPSADYDPTISAKWSQMRKDYEELKNIRVALAETKAKLAKAVAALDKTEALVAEMLDPANPRNGTVLAINAAVKSALREVRGGK